MVCHHYISIPWFRNTFLFGMMGYQAGGPAINLYNFLQSRQTARRVVKEARHLYLPVLDVLDSMRMHLPCLKDSGAESQVKIAFDVHCKNHALPSLWMSVLGWTSSGDQKRSATRIRSDVSIHRCSNDTSIFVKCSAGSEAYEGSMCLMMALVSHADG